MRIASLFLIFSFALAATSAGAESHETTVDIQKAELDRLKQIEATFCEANAASPLCPSPLLDRASLCDDGSSAPLCSSDATISDFVEATQALVLPTICQDGHPDFDDKKCKDMLSMPLFDRLPPGSIDPFVSDQSRALREALQMDNAKSATGLTVVPDIFDQDFGTLLPNCAATPCAPGCPGFGQPFCPGFNPCALAPCSAGCPLAGTPFCPTTPRICQLVPCAPGCPFSHLFDCAGDRLNLGTSFGSGLKPIPRALPGLTPPFGPLPRLCQLVPCACGIGDCAPEVFNPNLTPLRGQ